jgi:tetratricopeptide (TPR) repeat protein
MSEISLRDYLNRLDQLAQDGAADEALWHARHILQYYPKNVEAYRFVGRALVLLGRWDEASATLRRVLSVIPNDKSAHLLLSTVYERQQRPNEAIWHLERAFEQDPSDTYLIDELRRMYREHRQTENPRIQLTTAAVARQNIRSRDYDRAIEALRSALKRTPQRGDLRLLLAEALWQHGDTLDAAETALDVLQSYPDCLEANRMLASLWLAEQRPSDARRHLNRIEAIDPYLALELVQGSPADDGTFRLPMLDYQQQAHAQMLSAQPDWLQNIDLAAAQPEDEYAPPPVSGMLDQAFADFSPESAFEDQVSAQNDADLVQSDDDWLSQLDSIEMSYQLNTSALQSVTSPLSPDEADAVETEVPDLLSPPDDADQVFTFEWTEEAETPPATGQETTQFTGVPEANADEAELHIDEDPFNWMNMETTPLSDDASEAAAENAESDPLAWLRGSGIEVVEDAPHLGSLTQETEEIVYGDPEIPSEADPLNWLKDYSSEVVDAWEQEAATNELSDASIDLSIRSTDEIPSPIADAVDDEFPMPDLDMIVDDWSETTPPADPWNTNRAPQTMPLVSRALPDEPAPGDEPLDEWELNERLLNMTDDTTDDYSAATQQPAVPADSEFTDVLNAVPQTPPTSPLPAMTDEEWNALDRAMSSAPTSSEENIMSDSHKPELGWDDETPKDSEEASESLEGEGTTGILDWLKSNTEVDEVLPQEDEAPADADSTGSTGILSWLAQSDNPAYDVSAEQEPTTEEPTGSTGILNWLSQNRPVPPTMPLGQSNEEPEFSTENLQIPDNPDWLSDLNDNPETATPRGATGEMLDWLDEAVAAPGTTILSQEEADAGILPPDTEWLHEVYDEVKPVQSEVPSIGEITWDDETWQPEAAAEEPQAAWAAEEVLPDLPLTEPLVDEADDSLIYTDALAAAEAHRPDSQSASGDDSFAALADLLQTGTLDDGPSEPASTVAFAEGSDHELALTEPMSEEADTHTDWLSAAEPLAFDPLEEAAPAVETNPELSWDEEEVYDEAQAVMLEEGAPADPEPASSINAFADSLINSGETQNIPDWMNDLTSDAPISEAFAAQGEPDLAEDAMNDWLPEAEAEQPADDEAEAEPEAETPDWLSAAMPVAAAAVTASALADFDEDVLTQSADDVEEAAWDFEVEDAGASSLYGEVLESSESEAAADSVTLNEEADAYYTAFEDAVPENEISYEGETNAPDWLNAMVPGLDIDTTVGTSNIEDLLDEDTNEETEEAKALPEDFEWLNEIVDEESRSDTAVAVTAAQAPRFVFSRPPRWLRRLLELRRQPSEPADDDDLPAWLR